MRFRTRLERIERRYAYRGLDEPSLAELVHESALLGRWLAEGGYASASTALAAGVRTPKTFRYVTIAAKAQAIEKARRWRWARTTESVLRPIKRTRPSRRESDPAPNLDG